MKLSWTIVLSLLCCAVMISGHMDSEKAKAYLTQYQYMGHNCPHQELAEMTDTNPDMAYNMGLRMFQMHWKLPVTGELDYDTMHMMEKPRCGCADMITMEDIPGEMMGNMTRRAKRYSLFGGKWPTNDVTYKFLNYPRDGDMTREEIESETRRAFMVWEAVSPLRFRQARSNERANINIRFESYYHGDGSGFDGPGGTLAHAFAPTHGDTHFDESETWTLFNQKAGGTDYFQVAAHEFGHALGLGHSEVFGALMYPYYGGYQENFMLHSDDIQGIQARYGMPPAEPTTTTEATTTARPTTTTRPTQPTTTTPPNYPPTGNPDICRDMVLDAITLVSEAGREVIYGFRGSEYFEISARGEGIVSGYPRPIGSKWAGLPNNVDAALYLEAEYSHRWRWTGTRWVWERTQTQPARNYFFQRRLVWLYEDGHLVRGYPKYISQEFRGLPTTGNVDAAFIWNGNGEIYVVIGSRYYRLNKTTLRVEAGYPQSLSHWSGLPSRIDAAIKHTNRWTYVFSGDQYYRLSDSRMAIASSYPRSTDAYWLRCGNSA